MFILQFRYRISSSVQVADPGKELLFFVLRMCSLHTVYLYIYLIKLTIICIIFVPIVSANEPHQK